MSFGQHTTTRLEKSGKKGSRRQRAFTTRPCRQFGHLDEEHSYFFFLSSFFFLSVPHFPQDMFLHLLAELIVLMQLRNSVFDSLPFYQIKNVSLDGA